ncbi:MAG: phosphoribosylformylglycinamidine synthase subunit PurL [Thermoguttaceae bacterium]|nr:phosphoribosylformylglycinamidine synthase subunit PurL [Thermoguttaceae bacterium]
MPSNCNCQCSNPPLSLWEVDIFPRPGQPDFVAGRVISEIRDLQIAGLDTTNDFTVKAGFGYLVQGNLTLEQVQQLASKLFADAVVEVTQVAVVGDSQLVQPPVDFTQCVYVLPKPGVMDPVADSALRAARDFPFGESVQKIRTFKKYWFRGMDDEQLKILATKALANDVIEQAVIGGLKIERLDVGVGYEFNKRIVAIRGMNDEQLIELSKHGQLYLSLTEMRTIRDWFAEQDRDPTDIELETVAQTWSEHCSHKTLAGRMTYQDENGKREFKNMLKETVFAATVKIREAAADDDFCVSVFKDNAGIVTFDSEYNVVFKVETHNHPSALDPYGGANTGLGGVIRDPMGTGMGAKPIANTDVFCFAPPDTDPQDVPQGVLHPRRIMRGVVSGVRDYGNRMGIPTVNGAVFFDPRYLGNPLVYCGNIGLIPKDQSFKEVHAGDLAVAIGGRTGRDGIHGATFSSAELTHESETVSSGAVQIGNAITEKMVLDILLEARDRGLYSAVTDCGAGGFSSAVGEMGEDVGAEVFLDRAPLKYDGLSYTEIWISEAQERMVFSVPEVKWPEFKALCDSEDVEAVVIGRYGCTDESGNPKLVLKYKEAVVADLPMSFMHDGRPPVVREATYTPPPIKPFVPPQKTDWTETLHKILGSLNVASKEWIIRQYDHEVQAGSVVKPLVGVENDGPSDAAVLRPRHCSQKGIVIGCGMNPCFGDFDPYWMTASAIDEAVRNCVAVGADPSRIAILDNFCWGNTDRPETLGSLVRSALACYDVAVALGTPFISGKDSLNNEMRTPSGELISIPPSLLISAMGEVADVSHCVTMDLKEAGNYIYVIGRTLDEMGGSHFTKVERAADGTTSAFGCGEVPRQNPVLACEIFEAVHQAIQDNLCRSVHDLSEGGLAVAAAEMSFAGGLGVNLDVGKMIECPVRNPAVRLFSESNTRFLVEVEPENAEVFEQGFAELPYARLGVVTADRMVILRDGANELVRDSLDALKASWQKPLNF